jgi:hypothetical protein
MIDAAHQMESTQMEVTFSMGRERRGGMNKQGIVSFVKQALHLRQAGHDVKALEVTASDEGGGKAELLDFVDATLKATLEVEPSPLLDEFYRRRLECVRAAWEAHESDLV